MTPHFSRFLPLALLALTAAAPAQVVAKTDKVGDATVTELDAKLAELKAELERTRQVAARKAELAKLTKELADAKRGKFKTAPTKKPAAKKRSSSSSSRRGRAVPESKRSLSPPWFPILKVKEIALVTDAAGCWWYCERRDSGPYKRISLHQFGVGQKAYIEAHNYAVGVCQQHGYTMVKALDPATGRLAKIVDPTNLPLDKYGR